MEELLKASHREFTTGFYYGKPGHEEQNYRTSRYTKEYSFIGKVLSYNEETGIAKVEQRNKMNVGDHIEVFGPDISFFPMTITDLADWESGEKLESAPHAQQILAMHMAEPVKPGYILRKKEG